jgi:hypothetical protein
MEHVGRVANKAAHQWLAGGGSQGQDRAVRLVSKASVIFAPACGTLWRRLAPCFAYRTNLRR